MKILVIGGTRGIGRHLVEQAQAAGHAVTILVRTPSARNPLDHPCYRIIQGDALDPVAVAAAVDGQDAVCLCTGIRPTCRVVDAFSKAGRVVVDAMTQAGVRRLVCVTGIGAGDSRGHGGFLYDKIAHPLVLRTIYDDKTRQEEIVRRSNLDWTIIRPGFLTNDPATGRYRAVSDLKGVTARKVARADVAACILNELQMPQYVGKAVLVDCAS